jgi:hypothetical protein
MFKETQTHEITGMTPGATAFHVVTRTVVTHTRTGQTFDMDPHRTAITRRGPSAEDVLEQFGTEMAAMIEANRLLLSHEPQD